MGSYIGAIASNCRRVPASERYDSTYDFFSPEGDRRLRRHGGDAVLDLPGPLPLDCGRELFPVRIVETYGTLSPAGDNVILVCHALSGDAHAAGYSAAPVAAGTRDGFRAEERDGAGARGLRWWDGMIGPGKAFDTEKFFVVSTNLLGGCRGTTGPSSTNPATGRPLRIGFPGDHRGRHGPRRAGVPPSSASRASRRWRAVRSAACRRSSGQSCAAADGPSFRSPALTRCSRRGGLERDRQRHATDPDWQGGHYYGTGRAPNAGMGVARMVGHITYSLRSRSGTSSGAGCSSPATSATSSPRRSSRSRATCGTQADSFVKRFDANTCLYTSRALTYFDLARQCGNGRLADALRNVSARTLLIAFSSDWLYPPSGSEELAAALRSLGKEVELHVIDAPYGHDCFLLEEARQVPIIQTFLAR